MFSLPNKLLFRDFLSFDHRSGLSEADDTATDVVTCFSNVMPE